MAVAAFPSSFVSGKLEWLVVELPGGGHNSTTALLRRR